MSVEYKFPVEYTCPIAGFVMQEPMQLSCCKQNLDKVSLEATIKRLSKKSLEEGKFSCPLCRAEIMLIEKEQIEGSCASRIDKLIENSPLRAEIRKWVREDPVNRGGLCVKEDQFPEPSLATPETDDLTMDAIESILSSSTSSGSQWVLEALSGIDVFSSTLEITPSLDLQLEPEDNSLEARFRRDLIMVFNTIYHELPHNLRPGELRAPTQQEMARKILGWMDNMISSYPRSLIRTLNLHDLGLKTFPISPQLFPGLTSLDISGNQLTELPLVPSLKWLNARKNHITEVGDISSMVYLEKLLINGNPIKKISGKVARLPALVEAEFSNISPYFEGFPPEFINYRGTLRA